MKSALIAYLHKKGDTKITDNYGTLGLLSHIGKIQERMILRRLDKFAEEAYAYRKTHQGFRHGSRCADAAFMMNILDHLALEKGLTLEILKVFVDNIKAYDMVNREVLWMVLERRGIPMNLTHLIKSKLEVTTAKVKHYGKMSEEFILSRGLAQGGTLSPC